MAILPPKSFVMAFLFLTCVLSKFSKAKNDTDQKIPHSNGKAEEADDPLKESINTPKTENCKVLYILGCHLRLLNVDLSTTDDKRIQTFEVHIPWGAEGSNTI
ncbi:hypothetical protein ElyMa_000020400 [Elysia marginata]|uniref:Uncharacterized protein n=1 Tax=Elysia marginata TaxID=1093978 RepID=A0AAV4EC08_9GAST|nr:hypothetical protein ElyMa_000020400 [Elysia marginata]